MLAVATFSSVRSANRAARVAEESLLVGLRPLLLPSREEDRSQRVGFYDNHFVDVPGGSGTAELGEGAIYLTISVRNAGSGIAVLHGWRFEPDIESSGGAGPKVDSFRRLTRDLYIPAGDVGFWQGAVRDVADPQWDVLAERIGARERMAIDLLYGDHHGGQRVISRFSLIARPDGGWLAVVGRHWNVDRPDPR